LVHDLGGDFGGISHRFVGAVGGGGGAGSGLDQVLCAETPEDDLQGAVRVLEFATEVGLDLGRRQRPVRGPQGGEDLALQLTGFLPLSPARGHSTLTLTP
jgi:hypothetical protein